MDSFDLEVRSAASASPRTLTVVLIVAAFALLLSWLAVYAVPNALVVGGLITPWEGNADPRPRWMTIAFLGFWLSLLLLAGLFRLVSGRQLRTIDSMSEAE